jgi:hypothetical protein
MTDNMKIRSSAEDKPALFLSQLSHQLVSVLGSVDRVLTVNISGRVDMSSTLAHFRIDGSDFTLGFDLREATFEMQTLADKSVVWSAHFVSGDVLRFSILPS